MESGSPTVARGSHIFPWLNYTSMLLMMAVIAGILTTAMFLQYVRGEVPCPLCLLQRVALFGVCFGIMQNFRNGFSWQNTGFSLLSVVFLLVVSARQTLLDIYPRPGHEYIGSAVLGLHMPVWSVIIAVLLLVAYAAKMAVLGGRSDVFQARVESFPLLNRLAGALSIYVLVLAAVNFVSVMLQCGLEECHTFGYRLLQ